WQWIHGNADALGIDAQRVGVFGSSAGGGLAAALAQRVRDEDGSGLAFQLLESPMLDDRLFTPSSRLVQLAVWPRQANEFGWRCYLGPNFGKVDMPLYAVPARAQDLSQLPPAFISVGGADGFRDEDIEYALHLSQAGVPTELHVYPGAPHGYQMFVDSPVAIQNRRDARDWLARMTGP
ncbi:MAG TPA: alpha/beta hydrolase fold domain-containing protein, partial [Acidimicrobiales bacterium]|nr:alpha/beta hydrolase fold domain-containing protein [Acidimicrobiales bacterium]